LARKLRHWTLAPIEYANSRVLSSVASQRETVADSVTKGGHYCIESSTWPPPVAVRRALARERHCARRSRHRAKNVLRHPEARYLPWQEMVAPEFCPCCLAASFEVNEAMVRTNAWLCVKDELLAVTCLTCPDSKILQRGQLLVHPDQQGSIDPIEREEVGRTITTLKVQLSGQRILGGAWGGGGRGGFQLDAYEVITEDVNQTRP